MANEVYVVEVLLDTGKWVIASDKPHYANKADADAHKERLQEDKYVSRVRRL